MANTQFASIAASMLLMVVISSTSSLGSAQLTTTFYDTSCPAALPAIRKAVSTAVAKERRMAASLIRLHFHDCFVHGCDASLLLDDTLSLTGEKTVLQNFHSIRGFEVVDAIKSAVEAACPGVVSCADILAVAARDSSVYVDGPTWNVKLGRRDSTGASKAIAQADIPQATDNLDVLTATFARQGLTVNDMVALSGAHTIGQAQCVTFRERVYNDTNIDTGFASTRRGKCPSASGNTTVSPLDLVTPNSFDNNYYKNLLQKKGLLHSDQVMYGSGGSTDGIVAGYSKDRASFFSDFAAAMVKMGDINPLTGSAGEVRKNCRAIN